MLLGDFLDIDPAHVAEQHHWALTDPVPHDPGVVLVLDLGLRVDQHAPWHVTADLELEDLRGVLGRLLGRIRELDATGLHAPARKHLGLDHDGSADLLGDTLRLFRGLREALLGDRDPRLGDDRSRLVLEEAHGGGRGYKSPDGQRFLAPNPVKMFTNPINWINWIE